MKVHVKKQKQLFEFYGSNHKENVKKFNIIYKLHVFIKYTLMLLNLYIDQY